MRRRAQLVVLVGQSTRGSDNGAGIVGIAGTSHKWREIGLNAFVSSRGSICFYSGHVLHGSVCSDSKYHSSFPDFRRGGHVGDDHWDKLWIASRHEHGEI